MNKLKQWWCYHAHRKAIDINIDISLCILLENMTIKVSKYCRKCRAIKTAVVAIYDLEKKEFIKY